MKNPVLIEIKHYHAGRCEEAKVEIDCQWNDPILRQEFSTKVATAVKDALLASVWKP